MNIRAKMSCKKAASDSSDTQDSIRLEAVIDGSEENKQFSKWTPSASLDIVISNPDARGKFEVGKEYYVNITPVS